MLGAVAAFLAVTLGAFGAHGLRGRLSPEMMAVFQTGVQYHMATRSACCWCRRSWDASAAG